ncbi:MAG: ComEC/Rec2 family competence protein, partial [Opitutaceae bacterium]
MSSRVLGHRAPLLWLALPLMGGLAVGKVGSFLPVGWLLGIACIHTLFAVWSAWRAPAWWPCFMVAALFLAGAASYAMNRARLSAWEALPPREAHLALRIDRVFSQSDPKKVSGLATVARGEALLTDVVTQKIYFSLVLQPNQSAPLRSAIISTRGILMTLPRDPPGG